MRPAAAATTRRTLPRTAAPPGPARTARRSHTGRTGRGATARQERIHATHPTDPGSHRLLGVRRGRLRAAIRLAEDADAEPHVLQAVPPLPARAGAGGSRGGGGRPCGRRRAGRRAPRRDAQRPRERRAVARLHGGSVPRDARVRPPSRHRSHRHGHPRSKGLGPRLAGTRDGENRARGPRSRVYRPASGHTHLNGTRRGGRPPSLPVRSANVRRSGQRRRTVSCARFPG